MTSSFAQKAGKKLFEKHLTQYTPADPLYEYYTDAKGKQKRRKRELPPGLSKRDAAILKSVKRRAHYLDKGFSICGMRFGWTFVIGIIPGAGDVADASLNYLLVVRKSQKAEIPTWLLRRMLLNNAASALMGFVPVAGDVALAAFKANSRNAALLEEFLRIRGEEFLKLQAEKQGQSSTIGASSSSSPIPRKDHHQVKPGAGVESGERVEGEGSTMYREEDGQQHVVVGKERKGTLGLGGLGGSIWKRRSNGNGKGNGDEKKREGRFVEDVGTASSSPGQEMPGGVVGSGKRKA
ncbi:hypothetical protein JAAARDRAFT_33820 [Jaapia argillacea MUCL 33604]|uniref:DUF4112 domain-containing protein n=1 Tax=Jaapia argillacea MUCL 33604 TaxID=933084 RepID=A0A067PYW8_9AGAM|nr:hypothetical protein JAAARDRAFT_33820 [Jaapia argillacea MUCL 33604]